LKVPPPFTFLLNPSSLMRTSAFYSPPMNRRALLLVIPCECAPFTCDLVRLHSLQGLGCWVRDERCRNPLGNVVYEVRHYESACNPCALCTGCLNHDFGFFPSVRIMDISGGKCFRSHHYVGWTPCPVRLVLLLPPVPCLNGACSYTAVLSSLASSTQSGVQVPSQKS
jgi:hypothetical protein